MITEQEIEKIATLAKIEIDPGDMPMYMEEMEKMLCFAENMESDEDYMKQYTQTVEYSVLREDAIRPSFDHGEILSCADDSIDGFIRLRKKA